MTAPGRQPRPATGVVPWPVALVPPALCLVWLGGVLLLWHTSHGRASLWSLGDEIALGVGIGTALVGLVLGTLATIMLRHAGRRTLDPTLGPTLGPTMGWTMGAVGLFWASDGLAEAYVRLGTVTDHALPGMTFAVWFLVRFTALLPASIVLLALIFPEGRFVPGRWGIASRVCMTVLCLVALGYVVLPGVLDDAPLPPGVHAEWTTLRMLEPVAGPVLGALNAVSVIGVVVPIGVVVHRYRRSRGTARDQMRWLLWGALIATSTIVLTLVLDLGDLNAVAFFLVFTVVPVAMTVAVVDPQLVSIEDLLGRTVLLALLAVALVVIDFLVVAALSWVLDDEMAQSQVVLVVLLTTVLLYGPLRGRLSRGVRRLVFGDRANPYDVVAGLASTLESTDEGPEQLAAVAGSVASAFGVGFVSVEVDRSNGERIVATYGDRPAECRTLPITYRDADVGRLVLPARGLRSRLSRRDEELLGDLVRQAATAARTGRLAEELQASREGLVTAREEERRRIRRDLHDGLGPALSGVVFQLESARLLVGKDPDAAKAQIADVSHHVQDVVADVRRLVHDLRPPALDDRGLVGALRQQGERLAPVAAVEAGDLGVLPAAVEVAAYRIVSEAITNVARHADATACTVRLDVVDGRGDGGSGCALLVEVTDDGVGIAPAARAGVGLVGLRERAAELGGRSEVTCPSTGGTVVRAWLPLRSTS